MMLDCIAHRERPTLMEIRALPEVLTVEQVAAYLQLSVEEVNTAILHGEIPAARFLNKWRVKREVVDELLRKPAVDLADNETKAKEPPQLDSRAMDPAQEAGQNAAITKQDDELLLPVLNTGIQVSSCNESYDESAPPISSSVTKGRVMVFNPTEGTGQARMRDMRIVNLDVRDFVNQTLVVLPGDTIEFELDEGGPVLRGRRIRTTIPDPRLEKPAAHVQHPGAALPAHAPHEMRRVSSRPSSAMSVTRYSDSNNIGATIGDHLVSQKNRMTGKSPFPKTASASASKYRQPGASPGHYAAAQRAWAEDRDLEKAAELFKLAVERKDNPDAAAKSLASVFQQMRRDDEAISFLCSYLPQSVEPNGIENMLSTIYAHNGKHQEAIILLERILERTPPSKAANIHKRLSYSYLKLYKYESAEWHTRRALEYSPGDSSASRWLETLIEAKETGQYAAIDALFLSENILLGVSASLSEFMRSHLKNCDYFGLEAPKIVSQSFTERDAEVVAERARNEGFRRPRPRANLFLTAARILIDLQSSREVQIRQYLGNYCSAMAYASLAERKSSDVAASYYTELFVLAPEWDREVEINLSRYIQLLRSAPVEVILSSTPPPPEECLQFGLSVPEIKNAIFDNLLFVTSMNREIARVLLGRLHSKDRLRREAYSFCCQLLGQEPGVVRSTTEFVQVWDRAAQAVGRRRASVKDEFAFLRSATENFDSLPNQRQRLIDLIGDVRGTLDKQRVKQIGSLLEYVADYSQQGLYSEQERFAAIIKSQIADLLGEIDSNPTKFSLDVLRDYVCTLQSTIDGHFASVERSAEPQSIELILSVDSYTPNDQNLIECQIALANELGKSPASSIKIHVEPSPTGEYIVIQKELGVTQALVGGSRVSCEVPIQVTEKAKVSRVFTLYLRPMYSTRLHSNVSGEQVSFPIRLDDTSNFKPIANPYARWVQSGAVKDEKMFYGRNEFIESLLDMIKNGPANKSVVIYGQKRAGKSSIVFHLERRMEAPLLPIVFSIGEFVSGLSLSAFLSRIMRGVEEAYEGASDSGLPADWPTRPSISDIGENPEIFFHEYMALVQRCVRRVPELAARRLIVVIDEFSYIFGEILRGRCPDTIMKSWKAVLEREYFGCVLVGQDIMRNFIEAFPNEFQVAQSERVTYLSADYARQLIVEPIRIPDSGESRYRAASVQRIVALTAGSPYYLMLLCSRLVNYLNDRKATFITDAHVEHVKNELIFGNNSLTEAEFDNLITPGDVTVGQYGSAVIRSVLRDIAVGSRNQTHCDRSNIKAASGADLDAILEDLERRDVVERQPGQLYRIRVELFKEWLLFHQ
jgi:excisionase family DNA binding protein